MFSSQTTWTGPAEVPELGWQPQHTFASSLAEAKASIVRAQVQPLVRRRARHTARVWQFLRRGRAVDRPKYFIAEVFPTSTPLAHRVPCVVVEDTLTWHSDS